MKIIKTSARLVQLPDRERPGHSGRPVATIRIGTDEGVEGLGVAFSLGGLERALQAALHELGEQLAGEDPTRIEHIHQKLRKLAAEACDGSLFLMAQAAIDAALWDIGGKVAGLPLWRMAGGARSSVPTYASGAVGRELTDGQAAEAAQALARAGFRQIKFHLALPGEFSPRHEAGRARVVRDAVGEDIRIGCDVNGRWRFDQAIQACRALEESGLSWIEDPIAPDDLEGMARLGAQTAAPLMAGERNQGMAPFRSMLERRAVSILMIDFMMVGGITGWLKIAAMAEAFGVPVVSHLVPEIQAHLVGGVPNGLMAEHKDWLWDLFEEVPAFEDGAFVLPERPGLGLRFSRRIYGDGW